LLQDVKLDPQSGSHVTWLGEADEHPEPHANAHERPAM
jgi:hypothetical protein